jgi:hypothetical protein
MSFVANPYLDPRDLTRLPHAVRSTYARDLLNRYPTSPAIVAEFARVGLQLSDFGQSFTAGEDFIGDEARNEISILRLIDEGKYTEALSLATGLLESSIPYIRRQAIRCVAHSLLRLDRLQEAIDFVVEKALTEPALVPILPVEECASKLDKSTRVRLASSLSVPILLDLYSRHISFRFDDQRSYAYEDFLFAHGLSRPSELRTKRTEFDVRQLVYYLRFVCVPEIMEVSTAFLGPTNSRMNGSLSALF